MNIIQKYIPINTERRPGIPIQKIKYIVAHDTGNLNSTALQNVDFYIKTANEVKASAHTFIDDKDIIECIPETEKAYHVRRIVSNAIDEALALELCYFTDLERSKLAYKNYVEYIKAWCLKYKLNPNTDIVGHYKLDPTRRTDPLNAFKLIGKTWEDFIKDLTPLPVNLKDVLLKRVQEISTKVEELHKIIKEL